MEPTGEPSNNPTGNQAPTGGLHSKRLKDQENAILQNTLISQMDTDSGAGDGTWTEQQSAEDDQSTGSSLNYRPAHQPLSTDTDVEVPPAGNVAKDRVEERTLTDHLNKRLLSSFLEKLNERDLALPGVQRLDCTVADEDSNRAADEWWNSEH